MPPKKYTAFHESAPYDRIAKHRASDASDVRRYVGITCPHCDTLFVEIPLDSLSTNKASECKKHLLQCTAAAEQGVHVEPAKRKRPVEATVASTDLSSLQLRERLVEKDGELAAKSAENSRLITSNDGLRGRVSTLETQMAQLCAEMDQLRPLVPLVQRITGELGLRASVPPAASIDAYVEKIAGLKKAASVASVASVAHTKLKSRADLAAENDRLRSERDEHAVFKRAFHELARDPIFFKHISLSLHPDKRSRIPPEGQTAADVLFAQLQDARKRMV